MQDVGLLIPDPGPDSGVELNPFSQEPQETESLKQTSRDSTTQARLSDWSLHIIGYWYLLANTGNTQSLRVLGFRPKDYHFNALYSSGRDGSLGGIAWSMRDERPLLSSRFARATYPIEASYHTNL